MLTGSENNLATANQDNLLMTLTKISSNIFFHFHGLLYNVGSLFGMSLSKKMVAFISLEGHLLKVLVGLPGSNL